MSDIDAAAMIRLAVNEACANAGAPHGPRRRAAVKSASAKIVAMFQAEVAERERWRETALGYCNEAARLHRERTEAEQGEDAHFMRRRP